MLSDQEIIALRDSVFGANSAVYALCETALHRGRVLRMYGRDYNGYGDAVCLACEKEEEHTEECPIGICTKETP